MRQITLKDPIYQAKISLLIGGNFAQVRREMDEYHGVGSKFYNKHEACDDADSDKDEEAMEWHMVDLEERFYIWVRYPRLDLIYHELFHLVHDVLEVRGIQYSDGSEEAFAYWGAAIFEQILKIKL